MKAIQESMRERQEKEQKARDALSTAIPYFKKYMDAAMQKRQGEWETAKQEFMTVKMNELKKVVLDQAKKEHMLDENRKLQAKRQEEMRKKDKEKAEKLAKEGRGDEGGDEDGWGR